MPSENTRIWEKVSTTDPDYTKHVGQRGGFTAIDPTYTIQRATQVFGPCGEGWGWTAAYSTLPLPDNSVVVFADVTVWWMDLRQAEPGRRSYGPVRGCNVLVGSNGRLDEDAAKKAMTDALTKALAHLGFSADVYMGRYDDNRYVQGLRAEKRSNGQRAASKSAPPPAASADPDVASAKAALQAHAVGRNRGDAECGSCGAQVSKGEGFAIKFEADSDWRLACARCVSDMAMEPPDAGRTP